MLLKAFDILQASCAVAFQHPSGVFAVRANSLKRGGWQQLGRNLVEFHFDLMALLHVL